MPSELTQKRRKRLQDFIEPLRVRPGRAVQLCAQLRPRVQGRGRRQGAGQGAARRGRGTVECLPGPSRRAEHMGGAGGAPGDGHLGQGRADPPRDERGQPAGRDGQQLQGALRGRARPRLPVALRAAAAGARPDRHVQPLALRGGDRGARASRVPRAPETPAEAQRGTSGSGAIARSTTGSATSQTAASRS